jgi:hypoxanthine phosphoribosyltransferase
MHGTGERLINIPGLKIKKLVLTADQIQKRVTEIARQLNHDYSSRPVYVMCVLENGFMFTSDLVKQLDMPVVCSFVRPESKDTVQSGTATTEIFFTPEDDVHGKEILLVETLVQSGITTEFLIRNLMTRGAKSVKLVALLDKQTERRVMLNPDYFGFILDDAYVVGYGLGAPEVGRNLPFVASLVHE